MEGNKSRGKRRKEMSKDEVKGRMNAWDNGATKADEKVTKN